MPPVRPVLSLTQLSIFAFCASVSELDGTCGGAGAGMSAMFPLRMREYGAYNSLESTARFFSRGAFVLGSLRGSSLCGFGFILSIRFKTSSRAFAFVDSERVLGFKEFLLFDPP
jgi:hypothetical protein